MEKYEKIVLHIPHASIEGIVGSSWSLGIGFFDKVRKWTDWYTDYLFWSEQKNIVPVRFNQSRFIVDVERLVNDPLEEIGQGILYENFEDSERTMKEPEIYELFRSYFMHIDSLKKELIEDCLLIDCHSFPSCLSDVEICIGFNDDWSRPSEEVVSFVAQLFQEGGYKVGINTPYSNSLSPKCSFSYHSLMIEVRKSTYMDENTLRLSNDAAKVKNIISTIYKTLLNNGTQI